MFAKFILWTLQENSFKLQETCHFIKFAHGAVVSLKTCKIEVYFSQNIGTRVDAHRFRYLNVLLIDGLHTTLSWMEKE